MPQQLKILQIVHFILLILSVPYGFLAWLFGITAHVYDDPIYRINLVTIAAYDISALLSIILTLKFKTAYLKLLYVPFIFLALMGIMFIYFIIKY